MGYLWPTAQTPLSFIERRLTALSQVRYFTGFFRPALTVAAKSVVWGSPVAIKRANILWTILRFGWK